MSNIKIGIIGCGNMGGAIAQAIIKKGVAGKKSISLNDKDIRKATRLAKKLGAVPKDLWRLLKVSDIIIIAVKPQDFFELAKLMRDYAPGKTIVSIMAGMRIEDIAAALGKGVAIVRTMPNMPAMIGEGITCISYKGKIKHLCKVKEVFESVGKVMVVNESYLDAVTAVSGSGPAYLFYLADAMISAGKAAGLQKKAATELVLHTLHGASVLLKRSGESPADLVRKVSSKRGTTEAALTIFDKHGLKSTVRTAILKAHRRSRELSAGEK
jgi:pyrroline-5-carboxylate reductase